MEKVMDAATKFWQSEENLKKMTERALGKKCLQFKAEKLSGGFCSAVYLIKADCEKMVLKIASKDTVKLMWHEKDYVPIEAKMLKILNKKQDIPMPKLIYFDDSREICEVPYFFMSFLEGKPLLGMEGIKPEELQEIKKQVGTITKKICLIPAPYFGIPAMPETYTDKNSEFVYRLFAMLLKDAESMQIEIPGITAKELLELVKRSEIILDEVTKPCYAHTDTWDGNILVKDGKFSGLVDYAAILYGDELISHDFHDFSPEPDKAFLEGYGKNEFTEHEKMRIQIYKIWQRLGMVVERGYRNYEDKSLYEWVLGEFEHSCSQYVRMLGEKQNFG